MHEPLLAQAALPAPTAVCGIPLRRYSLGHELYLIREKSPFLFGGEVDSGALFDAVWICSSTWLELTESTGSWLYLPKLWFTRRRVRKSDADWEIESFRRYRSNGCLEFPLSEIARPSSAAAPRPPGAPFVLRLHQFLVTSFHKTEAEAWDYPVGLAKMRWACHWEQERGLDIYNEHDASFDRYIAEQEAKGRTQCRA